jgi:hypothetical protein
LSGSFFSFFTQFVEKEEGWLCQKDIPAEVELSKKKAKKVPVQLES